MREILFKAKRLDNDEWVEGYYYKRPSPERNEQHYILYPKFIDECMPYPTWYFEIDPNTLCQFTGLTDKNDNKIWENDIVDVSVCWWVFCDMERNLVKWDECKSGFLPYVDYDSNCDRYYYPESSKVIGNKFDNLELLKE